MNRLRLIDCLLGFSLCLCIFLLMGLTQISNRYDKEENIFREFQNLYLTVQPKQHIVRTSTPTVSDLEQGEFVITNVGGVQNIYTRIGDLKYRVVLSSN